MNPEQTLWVGNINQTMDENYIKALFHDEIDYIKNIRINLRGPNKLGSAFLEFPSKNIAQKVLEKYNNKTLGNFVFRLNWAKSNNQKYNNSKKAKQFTLYIGGLDLNTNEAELLDFLKQKFPSVTSIKIIYSSEHRSKGFGFIELTDEEEYNNLLNQDSKIQFNNKYFKIGKAINNKINGNQQNIQGQNNDLNNNSNNNFNISNNTGNVKDINEINHVNFINKGLFPNSSYYFCSPPPINQSFPNFSLQNVKEYFPRNYGKRNWSSNNDLLSDKDSNNWNNEKEANNFSYLSTADSFDQIKTYSKVNFDVNFEEHIKNGIKKIKQIFDNNDGYRPPLSLMINYYCNIEPKDDLEKDDLFMQIDSKVETFSQ